MMIHLRLHQYLWWVVRTMLATDVLLVMLLFVHWNLSLVLLLTRDVLLQYLITILVSWSMRTILNHAQFWRTLVFVIINVYLLLAYAFVWTFLSCIIYILFIWISCQLRIISTFDMMSISFVHCVLVLNARKFKNITIFSWRTYGVISSILYWWRWSSSRSSITWILAFLL